MTSEVSRGYEEANQFTLFAGYYKLALNGPEKSSIWEKKFNLSFIFIEPSLHISVAGKDAFME